MAKNYMQVIELDKTEGELNVLGAGLQMVNCETRSVSCWRV